MNANPLTVGNSDPGGNNCEFNGDIDEVKIFNKCLSDAEIFAEYKPIDPLRTSITYRKARLVRNDNRVRTFDSDLVTVRSTYQFTRFIFTRLRMDYDATSDNFTGQLLFGWNPSPGTAFYAGYNDNFNYNGVNPFTGNLENGFERNSRTFFIRASYLFRKSF